MSHQNLSRSYGDEATTKSLVRQTRGVGERTQDPWVQGEWITYPPQHGDNIWLSTSTSNTCADPGILARGGGSRPDSQKTALTTFLCVLGPQLILQWFINGLFKRKL